MLRLLFFYVGTGAKLPSSCLPRSLHWAVWTNYLTLRRNSVLCASVAWKYSFGLAETEFGGGTLTGPLLALYCSGGLLSVLALLLTFVYPKGAALGATLASLLCWPLYLYFAAPGPF
jgi:hypothetical protein